MFSQQKSIDFCFGLLSKICPNIGRTCELRLIGSNIPGNFVHGTGMVPKTTRFQIFIACVPWIFLPYDSQIIPNPTKNDTLPKFNSQNPWS